MLKGKQERHKLIKQIVKENKVSSQEELSSLLEQYGLSVAQATLSRDIRELKITKAHEDGGYCYKIMSSGHSRGAVADPAASGSIVSFEVSGSIAVVKTRSGHAAMVASVIDGADLEQVMGTIAGDDAIFMALREGADVEALADSLSSMFKGFEDKRL